MKVERDKHGVGKFQRDISQHYYIFIFTASLGVGGENIHFHH